MVRDGTDKTFYQSTRNVYSSSSLSQSFDLPPNFVGEGRGGGTRSHTDSSLITIPSPPSPPLKITMVHGQMKVYCSHLISKPCPVCGCSRASKYKYINLNYPLHRPFASTVVGTPPPKREARVRFSAGQAKGRSGVGERE